MWPDRVANPGPLALESDALPTELHSQAKKKPVLYMKKYGIYSISLCRCHFPWLYQIMNISMFHSVNISPDPEPLHSQKVADPLCYIVTTILTWHLLLIV